MVAVGSYGSYSVSQTSVEVWAVGVDFKESKADTVFVHTSQESLAVVAVQARCRSQGLETER